MAASSATRRAPPLPYPDDGLPTETSRTQADTEDVLLGHFPASGATPTLNMEMHKQWLARNLIQGFPARYQAYDCSQPWLSYWTLQAFCAIGIGMDPASSQRIINQIMKSQHPEGGFGGGPGQNAHLLPTYAAVCALSIVGRPGPDGGWDQIDRTKLYAWFISLKQPDGSFIVSHDSEVDVRGTYCLLVVATLLDMLTPELVAGTAAFVASCQTYEGGFASASQPSFGADAEAGSPRADYRPPLGEAHGGYTFCALGAWALLRPFTRALPAATRPRLRMRAVRRWLAAMQGGGADLGGFRGRTNKLVDGCYAWWVGGAFGLLGVLDVDRPDEGKAVLVPELYSRAGLQEYVLWAGQHASGGLRDKPPKPADSYHTLYCLSGLSAAQHQVYHGGERAAELAAAWTPSRDDSHACPDALRKAAFVDALAWSEEETEELLVGGESNRVNATHPVFTLTMTHTEGIMAHFYGQTIPERAE